MTREMTDEQVAREVGDITADALWPNWPILPVKKYPAEGDILVGIVLAHKKSTIYRVNLWDLKPNITIGEQIKDLETVVFEDVEALVRDGWMGD